VGEEKLFVGSKRLLSSVMKSSLTFVLYPSYKQEKRGRKREESKRDRIWLIPSSMTLSHVFYTPKKERKRENCERKRENCEGKEGKDVSFLSLFQFLSFHEAIFFVSA
jgi:hypothetical protein